MQFISYTYIYIDTHIHIYSIYILIPVYKCHSINAYFSYLTKCAFCLSYALLLVPPPLFDQSTPSSKYF